MAYIFYFLLRKNYVSLIFIILFHLIVGFIYTFASGYTETYSSIPIAYIFIPGLLISTYDFLNPITSARIENNKHSLYFYLFSLALATTFITTIITQYLQGFDYSIPLYQNFSSLLFWVIFAIQSKVVLINFHHENNLWQRIKNGGFIPWTIMIDLVFAIVLIIVIISKQDSLIEMLFFIYGFRLFRLLLLIPYFDQIWSNIKRGLRLTGNYISAFVMILMLFSVNSRILFSRENNHFENIPISIFTNFKIILGNGFDIVSSINNNKILIIYIFGLTLIIGIIFTSTITALITDSLLTKKETDDNAKKPLIWYEKEGGESTLEHYIRVVNKIVYL